MDVCVLKASNTIEAHLISDLLVQNNIGAYVTGEFLQSGIGEVSAEPVRVYVDSQSEDEAKEIIEEWFKSNPEVEPLITVEKKSGFNYVSFIIGGVIGSVAMATYYNIAPDIQSMDLNRDGKPDAEFVYHAKKHDEYRSDRNFDGAFDYIQYYNHRGEIRRVKADNNFDGVFETRAKVKNGNWIQELSDTNGDGFEDVRTSYVNGVIHKTEVWDAVSNSLVKTDLYDGFKVIKVKYAE